MATDAYEYFSTQAGPGRPLLFLFHGTGGNERQLLPLAEDVAPWADIIAPLGDVSEYGAPRFFRRTGEGVYDMDDLARATAKMTGFIRAHIESRKPSAVLGVGYSNGANILASIVFSDPSVFDGAVLMHPLIPFEPRWGLGDVKTRLLITAGRRDPICPPDLTNRLVSHLEAAGVSTELVWHEGGHELRKNEIDASNAFLSAYGDTPGQEK